MAKKRKPVDRDRFDMRLDGETKRRIESQAKRFNLSISAYVRLAIVKQVEADETGNRKV